MRLLPLTRFTKVEHDPIDNCIYAGVKTILPRGTTWHGGENNE